MVQSNHVRASGGLAPPCFGQSNLVRACDGPVGPCLLASLTLLGPLVVQSDPVRVSGG